MMTATAPERHLVRPDTPAEPETAPQALVWRDRGCLIPRSDRQYCGRPVYAAYALHTVALPLPDHLDDATELRAVLMCREHHAALDGANGP
jgi:hypothetical protein